MSDLENEIDDIIDNFDLKPITKGLGFHHSLKEKKEIQIDLKQQSKALQNELETRLSQLNLEKAEANKAHDMGELAPFYASTDTVKETDLNLLLGTSTSLNYQEASTFTRAVAWLIDCSIIVTLMLTIFSAIIYFSNIPMDVFNVVMVSENLFQSFALISAMFYIFYFSFFEKTIFSTPGKNILNIRVQSVKENFTLTQSFMRSILGLGSILMLGLPLLLKVHDKLTDTIVVQK